MSTEDNEPQETEETEDLVDELLNEHPDPAHETTDLTDQDTSNTVRRDE